RGTVIKFWGNPLVKCYFRMDMSYLNSFVLLDVVLLAAVAKAWPRRGKFLLWRLIERLSDDF
ncbi:hypothetical protein ACXWRK_09080, partial [Streptococcus pyogenes]